MKVEVKKERFISPQPWTIVSCRNSDGKDNALSIGLIANVSLEPEIVMIAVRKERYSHQILDQQKEFVVNMATKEQKELIDYFGSYSGRVVEKLSCYNTMDADMVDAPIILDCPVNFECKVIKSMEMGSHDLFFGEVVKAHCDKKYLNNDGSINWKKINPIHSLSY